MKITVGDQYKYEIVQGICLSPMITNSSGQEGALVMKLCIRQEVGVEYIPRMKIGWPDAEEKDIHSLIVGM